MDDGKHDVVDAGAVADQTLIDALLELTPEERLRQNDRMLHTIRELRDGFSARRPDDLAGKAGGERR